MHAAIDGYMEYVEAQAMGTTIKLFKGVVNSHLVDRRPKLLTFLKGSQKAKAALRNSDPEMYQHFETVWKLRSAHVVKSQLPLKYAFILHCCGKRSCIHPLCSSGKATKKLWSPDGVAVVKHLPLPVQSTEPCNCEGVCPGHYLKEAVQGNPAPVPSVYLAAQFAKNSRADPSRLIEMSKVCMLKAQDVKFYWEHMTQVKKNRARGVEKAKKTRAKKKSGQ